MKKQLLWMLSAILTICGATLTTSCSSDDDDNNPVTPVADDVRLVRLITVTLGPKGDTLAVVTQHLTWERGLLKQTNAIIRSVPTNSIIASEDHFVYEGTNCTEILHGTGTHDYFTYTDGRLSTAVSTTYSGSTIRSEVTAYTADGHVSEMTREVIDSDNSKTKVTYTLTWENGDLKSYEERQIEPADDDDSSETYSFTYYDVPSPYTGYPVAQYIWDPYEMSFRGTKHFVQTGENAKFENGRIVAETRGPSVSYYIYSDGTGSTIAPRLAE